LGAQCTAADGCHLETRHRVVREPRARRKRPHDTPEGRVRRIAYLERIDRRCFANSGKCVNNAATREFTVRHVDPSRGQPTGEPYKVKTCTRHTVLVAASPSRYQVLEGRELPTAEGQGNRNPRYGETGTIHHATPRTPRPEQ
jgi:hypothetical protein